MGDHWVNDLFIPKWVVKTILYVVLSRLPVRIGLKRLATVLSGRLHRVPEVMEIDRKFDIPSTFFVGMQNGLGMSYSLRKARQMVELVQSEGFAVGVHGVAYDNAQLIREEHDLFVSIVGKDHLFGVRNHYLRFNTRTPALQAEAGYLFDSSDYGIKAPYKVKGLVEFPVCLMDSYLLSDHQNDLEDVKRRTLEAFQAGERSGLPYFTIIFHDVYFSELFPEHQAWYQWLIQYVRERYEVTDFAHAVAEMKAT